MREKVVRINPINYKEKEELIMLIKELGGIENFLIEEVERIIEDCRASISNKDKREVLDFICDEKVELAISSKDIEILEDKFKKK